MCGRGSVMSARGTDLGLRTSGSGLRRVDGVDVAQRRAWRFMLFGTVLWLALAAWSVSSPVGASPDDDFHIANIYCAAGAATCTESGERQDSCFNLDSRVPAHCQTAGSMTLPRTTGINTRYYPPIYYATMGPLVGDTVAETTIAVRWANVTLAVVMAMGSVALSARPLRRAVAGSWVVSSVPLGVFVVSSINPSAWTVIGVAAIWGPLISFLRESGPYDGRSFGRIVLVLGAALMALGSRTESVIFVAVVAVGAVLIATAIPWASVPLSQRYRLWLPVALMLQAVLFNYTFRGRKSSGEITETFSAWEIVTRGLDSTLAALHSPALGSMDTHMPVLVGGLALAAYAATVVQGLGSMDRRKAVVLSAFVIVAFAVLARILMSASHVGRLQPRYFLPFVFLAAGLALLPLWSRPTPKPSPLQTAVVLAVLAIANSVALLQTLGRYIVGVAYPFTPGITRTPTPGVVRSSGRPGWWWDSIPFTPFTVWVLGSAMFTAVLIVVWFMSVASPAATALEPEPDASALVPEPDASGRGVQ